MSAKKNNPSKDTSQTTAEDVTEENTTSHEETTTEETANEETAKETKAEEKPVEVPLEEQEVAPNDWDDIEDTKELKKMLTARTAESVDYLDKLKRLKAEYTNYQNRMVRERERIGQFAIQSFAEDVFHVLDTFSMALDNAEKLEVPDTMTDFVKGIAMTKDQLFDALKKRGVEEIEAEGKPFDPHFMEALTTMPGEVDNQVMQVFRTGYKIGDRALRPSQVIVSKAPAAPTPPAEEKAEDEPKETVES